MIAFERFTKDFGRRRAVAELDLAVRAGEVVAMLGPNGSGKTTSLKAAAGLIRPTAGCVRLGPAGLDAGLPAARRWVSFLPQRVVFPDALTGREVVEFYRRLRGLRASSTDEALCMASLNGAGEQTIGTYSGGMVQRLGLAVATMPDTPVLLLDEPTAALDPVGLAAFYAVVEARRARGRAVLFTSHQLGDVERLADRVAILVEGRLVRTLSRTALVDRLAERGVMRVRTGRTVPGRLARLNLPGAVVAGDEIHVRGRAADRLEALDRLRAEGIVITGFSIEEGRLDAFYRELVGGGDDAR